MINHTVFFAFRSGVTDEQKRTLLAEYPTFPKQFPTMRNFTLGSNISQRDQTFEYAFNVQFDTEEDLKAYLNSDAHEEHVTQRFKPLISQRAIVSYSVSPGAVTDLDV